VSAKTPIARSSIQNRSELLKTLGVVVLVLGFVTSGAVYWNGQQHSASQPNSRPSSQAEGGWKDSTLSPEDLKGSSRTIEMNYGKTAVLVVSWFHWWEQLKPHESLAIIIATISIIAALSCFMVARRCEPGGNENLAKSRQIF